jgi:predicted nucleotidyltransferase
VQFGYGLAGRLGTGGVGPKRGAAATLTAKERDALKQQIVACLRNEPEVRRIVLFGSFVASPSPQDVDVAVFQESVEGYLPLALKYHRLLRPVANRIPVDVIPLRATDATGAFLHEIEQGEVVYVR